MDNKITLKEFFESEKVLYIRCTTLKQAKKLLTAFHKLGKKWESGRSYLEVTHFFEKLGSGIEYNNKGQYQTSDTVDEDKTVVYDFNQVDFEDIKKMFVNKKLCDVTLEEYKLWVEYNCEECKDCMFRNVRCGKSEENCWVNHKDLYSNTFLNQTIEVKKKPILNDKEKESLKGFLSIYSFKKIQIRRVSIDKDWNHLELYYQNAYTGENSKKISLPEFEANTMFTNMYLNEWYTTEDLGL